MFRLERANYLIQQFTINGLPPKEVRFSEVLDDICVELEWRTANKFLMICVARHVMSYLASDSYYRLWYEGDFYDTVNNIKAITDWLSH